MTEEMREVIYASIGHAESIAILLPEGTNPYLPESAKTFYTFCIDRIMATNPEGAELMVTSFRSLMSNRIDEIVAFSSHDCPACNADRADLQKHMEENPGQFVAMALIEYELMEQLSD